MVETPDNGVLPQDGRQTTDLATRNLRDFIRLAWTAALVLVCLASVGTSIEAATLPADRSALILYKCLPYNEAWENLESIDVEVVVLREEDLGRAETFATVLAGIASQARAKDPNAPSVTTRTREWNADEGDPYADSAPQIVFVLATGAPADSPSFGAIGRLAIDHSFLIATDHEELLQRPASLGILLSSRHKPEIVIDLERTRAQGSRFSVHIKRLARLIGEGR